MSFGLIIVEDRAALRAVIAPSTRNLLRAALPLAVGAGVAIRLMLALPWPRALLLGAAVGLGATLVAALPSFSVVSSHKRGGSGRIAFTFNVVPSIAAFSGKLFFDGSSFPPPGPRGPIS